MSLPVIAMIIAVGQMVGASEYQVTATVPAPLPTSAPIITSPLQKSIIKTQEVTVSGTCPSSSPAIIVALYDNSSLVGSQQCDQQQQFAIPISLSLGAHSIQATVTTVTGQTGASSDILELTRVEEVSSDQSNATIAQEVPEPDSPLVIVSDQSFVTFESNRDAVWHGRFTGGDAPYNVDVSWGDGDLSKLTGVGREEQALRHHYIILASYDITVRLTDAKGRTSLHQTAAVTLADQTGSLSSVGIGQSGTDTGIGLSIVPLQLVAVYLVVIAALTFLWHREHGRKRRLYPVRVTKQTANARRRR